MTTSLRGKGSRRGRFSDALAMMRAFPDMPLARLITHRYPLHKAMEAFAAARNGQALKVVLETMTPEDIQ